MKHRRVGPAIDVALCGARENLTFAQQRKHVDCPGCREKHAALVAAGHPRVRQQNAARNAQLRTMVRDHRWSPQ